MFKNLLCIVIFLGINLNVYAINSSSYTIDDIIKIVIILGIVILIFSPAKFRIIVIGTMLGLAYAYFTYKLSYLSLFLH
ncbi:putative membrane protein [Rickettsia endosymbiont of Ixodes pacificus]|nr:putative membrane protein [Rickettsia endosymbiont of Ixodes pacificus]